MLFAVVFFNLGDFRHSESIRDDNILRLNMKQIIFTFGLAFLTAFNILGCASIKPAKDSTPTFIRAAETKEKDNVRVAVAVLTEAESREYFGRPLEPGGIQAIWLMVENRNGFPEWILPRFTDPDYFSALEVAYRNHSA